MWCGGCYGKFEHENIAVQNSILVARAEASHASRFFKNTWIALLNQWKKYGSGATFMVRIKKSAFVCVCRSPGYWWRVPKMACSMFSLSLQKWGSIPQTPSVTRTANIYTFLNFFFFPLWLAQLHNAASCNHSSVVLLGNSVSFSYWIEDCHIGVDYLPCSSGDYSFNYWPFPHYQFSEFPFCLPDL